MCQEACNITAPQKCRRVVWINSWALQIHCNPRVSLGSNKLVLKGWMKRDHRGLQKIYVMWYSFCILGESFAIHFEVNQLPCPRSYSEKYENHLFLISNDEKWSSLKKSFWKIYHHSKCFSRYYRNFVFSTSINIQEARFYVWKFLHWRIKNI